MAQPSRTQKAVIARVMSEYKHGELPLGRNGRVRNPRQAIAIALSEAGASNRVSPAENRRHLAHTLAAEAEAGQTRAALYRRAQAAGIPGRSRMSRDELRQALARQGRTEHGG